MALAGWGEIIINNIGCKRGLSVETRDICRIFDGCCLECVSTIFFSIFWLLLLFIDVFLCIIRDVLNVL